MCTPVPALARWSRGVAPAVARARRGAGGSLLVAEVLISGFSGSGRPELEFRTPYSRHFSIVFVPAFFFVL